ncbi:MAG: SHOCT domain-containing protein [Intestinimonas sp.]|jgi:hypothetical protein|nr:SHOCT domain-containing protein [Intestinimonas sp.]
MGLLGKTKSCGLCGQEKAKFRCADGYICKDCMKKVKVDLRFSTPRMTIGQIKNIDANQDALKKFNATKIVGKYIEFDDEKKQWLAPDKILGRANAFIHSYSEIIEFELLEDGDSVVKGGLGSAITGSLLFGGVGAIVGATIGNKKSRKIVNSLKIKITLDNIDTPVQYIDLLTAPAKSGSILYKAAYDSAQEILSALSVITKESEPKNETPAISAADEIKKFKQLLDDEIISQDEFEAKKKQLLGI